jgi:hypothetical protein
MVQILPKGTSVKEEELQEIQELQAEKAITEEEENAILVLTDTLKRLKDAFDVVLADNDISNPNAMAKPGQESLFYERAFSMLKNQGNERYDITRKLQDIAEDLYLLRSRLDELPPRIYRIMYKAKEVYKLIIDIEAKVIRLSHLPLQRGRSVIMKIIKLDEDQRKNLKRKVVGIGEIRNMVVLNNQNIGDIYIDIQNSLKAFAVLRDYVKYNPWQNIKHENVIGYFDEFRKLLGKAKDSFDGSIQNLEDALSHIEDFKHWLAHSVHESKRALKFQEKIDKIIESQGIDQYRDGADKTFGKPWG